MSQNQMKPVCRKNEIVIQELDNEVLVYDLKNNKAFCLNETSAVIWRLCDGTRSIDQIAVETSEKFDSPISKEFVLLALEQFRKDNLLDNENDFNNMFSGVSRREVIKKVGFTSLLALPIVSSLTAPMAAHAQSVACVGACQCPNATVNFCSPAAGGGTLDCNALPNSPTGSCRCRLPFGAPASGTSPGQKVGNCG